MRFNYPCVQLFNFDNLSLQIKSFGAVKNLFLGSVYYL